MKVIAIIIYTIIVVNLVAAVVFLHSTQQMSMQRQNMTVNASRPVYILDDSSSNIALDISLNSEISPKERIYG